MIKVLFLLLTLLLTSCEVCRRSKPDGKIIKLQSTYLKSHYGSTVDSFFIEYSFSRNSGRSFNYVFNGLDIEISETTIESKLIHKTNSEDTIYEFFRFINDFCITKTEKVEISRIPRQDTVYADYPMLTVYSYKNNMEMAAYKIPMSEETYNIIFNPIFVKFLDTLESLTNY
jgi:hypothetical protein